MANITFIIGNGFDLRVGLRTRYIDFYKEYTKETANDNELIHRFKKSILQNFDFILPKKEIQLNISAGKED